MTDAAKRPPTKTEVTKRIAETTGLTKNQVDAVMEALAAEIQESLGPNGAGAFTIPGLVKITKKTVPARPAQQNVPNPFKPGEFRDLPAKPATSKVQVRPLKGLKDMI